jgi:hypothetical protein
MLQLRARLLIMIKAMFLAPATSAEGERILGPLDDPVSNWGDVGVF